MKKTKKNKLILGIVSFTIPFPRSYKLKGQGGYALAKIRCCGIHQKAELTMICPTVDNVLQECVFYLKSCVICNKEALEIYRVDVDGQVLTPVRLKPKNIKKFLSKMITLWKPKSFSETTPKGKFYLHYCDAGVKMRCYGNLSSMNLGKIETNPLTGLNNRRKQA